MGLFPEVGAGSTRKRLSVSQGRFAVTRAIMRYAQIKPEALTKVPVYIESSEHLA